DKVAAELKKEGHTLVDVSLPHTEYSVAVYYVVAVCEASSNLARFDGVRFGARVGGDRPLAQMYEQTRALFGEEVKRRILLGTFALSAGYYDAYYKKACQVRRLIKNDFDAAFRVCDAILAPVAPSTAFKLGEKSADPLQMYLNDILTIPANLAGLPGIAVPAGRDARNLPIGVQFLAPPFAEGDLFALAKFVEDHVHREEVSHGI
ncbi:MAG: Asp-tRNA(Asn)/Glu-tRNA(Gln) amidotransferase subunit GatA, partial [Deltaproteobacteria bacterium]|nr:Asp-tRNA(Asn)/Glu-tRNA(Gln) amidotransferase subunit GatA [Deltaproteobacteria bacterium]